jgi:small-conductance mechanosensitive channel
MMEFGESLLLGVSVWTLAASAGAIGVAAAADAVLRWLVRRKLRRDESVAGAAHGPSAQIVRWIDRGLKEALPPAAALIWIAGGYAALAPLVPELLPLAAGTRAGAALGWARDLGVLASVFWLLSRVAGVVEAALRSVASRLTSAWDDALLPVAGRGARVLLPLAALIAGVQTLAIPDAFQASLRTALTLVLIGTAAFLLYQCVDAVEALVLRRYRLDVRDNLEARAVYTQVRVLKKITTAAILIFTAASMLMVFESVRQFGASILASAGIAGIIVGFAAQRSIATLVAGFQIAVTQPIRIDDVVIVQNEWGRIEDITLTYVTVRIWDQRRLIVPITHFLEQPFQNWTRTSAEILGTVFLHVDYRAPLDAIREELSRILRQSPFWDGKVNVLQVTEAKEHTLEIRALASAADASLAWDLRCEIREKLIQFLQRDHPESLPRVRAEFQPAELTAKRARALAT